MTQQLGFGFDQLFEEQQSAHLPSAMEEAIPVYRGMIERHHAAMLAADEAQVKAIRKEAHRLAVKLNNGEPGILADRDTSPGYVLTRETAAPAGTVPMWGQQGEFTIDVKGMKVRCGTDHEKECVVFANSRNNRGRCGAINYSEHPHTGSKVILTVAHLDHQPENCDDKNLKAMCQRCHNRYDMPMRRAGMKARQRAQLAIGELL